MAAERWPREGIPANPSAWLISTGRNRAIDRLRRDRTLAGKTRLLLDQGRLEGPMTETTFPDERLELIFTCCHPALAVEAQVALTLRTLGGLTTGEIARAFLVPEPTMAQRLVRAKRKIADGRHPLPRAARPPAAGAAVGGAGRRLPDLQRGLLGPQRAVGRGDPAGPLAGRADAGRARGARAAGADAAARRPPRRPLPRRRPGAAGRPGPLAVGRRRRSAPARRCSTGRSRCTAAAPTSCRRRSRRCTRTSRATGRRSPLLYGELSRLTGSPVVELNRAVAVAETDGPEAALAIVERPRPRRLPLPALDPRRPAAPDRPRRRGPRRRTGGRSSSSTTTPSGGCSNGGWPSSG